MVARTVAHQRAIGSYPYSPLPIGIFSACDFGGNLLTYDCYVDCRIIELEEAYIVSVLN